MLVQIETNKHAVKHFLFIAGGVDVDLAFFAFDEIHPRLGDDPFADSNRFDEFDVGAAQHHVGMVDGDHGRVVGQTENKTAVNQPLSIHRHTLVGVKGNPAVSIADFLGSAAEFGIRHRAKDIPLWQNRHDDFAGKPVNQKLLRLRNCHASAGVAWTAGEDDDLLREMLAVNFSYIELIDEQIGRLVDQLKH